MHQTPSKVEPLTKSPAETSDVQALPADSPSPQFVRPVFVQKTLPPAILLLKEEGNKLFRSGQYASAIDQYSKAISKLEKGETYRVFCRTVP